MKLFPNVRQHKNKTDLNSIIFLYFNEPVSAHKNSIYIKRNYKKTTPFMWVTNDAILVSNNIVSMRDNLY